MTIEYGLKKLKTLEDLDVGGKTVFVRVDYNVPIEKGEVADDTRIRATLPTLNHLVKQGARLLLASHLGRPKGGPDPKYSLLPAAERLARLIGKEVVHTDDCVGDGVRRVMAERRDAKLFLLENVRFHPAEEKNDPKFAGALKHGADLYVSDAFGSLHRAHASTDALPRLFPERAIGFLVRDEVKFLTPLLTEPAKPYAVILGGAKVSDKIKVLERFVTKVDALFLGGAMVFTFLKTMGHKVGNSLVEDDRIEHARRILDEAKKRNVKVHLPKDFLLGKSVDEPGTPKDHEGFEIPDGFMGLDIGPRTVAAYTEELRRFKTIFWNGPMGLFETPPFDRGTVGVARALAGLDSIRVVGGGDSVSALEQAGAASKMTHVSTGGGATLEFLEGKPLPGLEALAV
jgi:phosphoglycerate kinase